MRAWNGETPRRSRTRSESHDTDHRDRLEQELVDRYRDITANRRQTMAWIPRGATARWATVGLALVLGAAACATPTTTEREMGQQLGFTFDTEARKDERVEAFLESHSEMVKSLGSRPGVDEVSVNVRESPNELSLEMILWGKGIDASAIARELRERHPVLAEADFDSRELTTRVRESLGAKLSRNVFHLELGSGSEEEMRAELLAQLAAQGFEGDATVDVQRDGDMTTIGVTISGEGHETADVIEIIGEVDGTNLELPVGATVEGNEDGIVKVLEVKVKGVEKD